MGFDPDYSVSQAYHARGWPTFVVVDAAGIVRFDAFDPDRNLSALRRCVEELLAGAAAGPKPALTCGVAIPAEALACRQSRRDCSPRLAFDKAGNPNVVYYSNREGTNAVYWRRYNSKGEAAGEDRLSPAQAEAYAADCAFDAEGTLWATWCGKQDGTYNIYVQSRPEGGQPGTQALTQSEDDAMSPKMAAGPGGLVTVAYYKWAKMQGISRDRNIFARTWEPSRKAWSAELEISPPQPAVEDHTDPDVVFDAKGRPWVAWSFDYHPQLYRQPVQGGQPTIFAARAGTNSVSAPMLVGATGQFRDAIDLFPSVALDGQGTLWCAWDCSEPQRCIRLARLNATGDKFNLVSTFGQKQEVCSTPELSAAGAEQLLLTWSQRVGKGHWQARVTLLKAGLPVAKATLSEPAADVLFPQAQRAPDGQYWVAYEKSEAKGAEVVLRNISRELGDEQQTTSH